MSIGSFEIPVPVLVLGGITGMTYGILAVGLLFIYRSNRIVNFAHGEIGALAAAMLGLAVTVWHVPYWVAFPLAIGLGAAVGSLSEVMVIRRLRRAPSVMSIVATLGLAQFLLLFSFAANSQATASRLFPQPPWLPDFDVGALRVTPAYSGMLLLTPVLVLGLALFLRRSRFGLAIRASAAGPETARMIGVSSSAMSTLAWAIAGGVSAYTAILVYPTRGFITASFMGPGLLLRALAAAVIARMFSLPIALGAAIAVGTVEQLLLWNYPQGGLVEAVLFGIILVGLLAQRRQTGRDEEKGSWASVEPWPPLPDAFKRVWTIRNLGKLLGASGVAVGLLLPTLTSHANSIILIAIVAFSLVGLSIGVVTGLGGQLSLGQFAIAGVGASASALVSARTGNYLLGFLGAGLAAAAVSLVIGLPALRIRGLMLAVTTLGFALACQGWLLSQPWMLGEGVTPGRPVFAGLTLDTGKRYYYLALLFLLVGFWLARNIWRGGLGRRLRALRDNEDGARAFTVPATLVKIQSFMLAGFLAGLGGAVFGHALSRISSGTFLVGSSLDLVAMTVLGGIGILAGPLIGALYIIGIPRFIPLDSAGLAASALGWLVLILYFPGGIAQLIRPFRERGVDWLAKRAGLNPSLIRSEAQIEGPAEESLGRASRLVRTSSRSQPAGEVLLKVSALTKSFGGVQAVNSADLEIRSGEILGLIGPNGAGKTTLFELISGFVRPDSGKVHFEGREIGHLGPEARGRLGLIRSFQDSALFPTLTVLETVMVSLERVSPTRFFSSAVGSNAADRGKGERARELIELMGLSHWRDMPIRALSTGTRRITELCCLLALEPKLLLLDEPTSGIAQRESEVLGELLRRLKAYLDLTLVVIEHDMPLVMDLADRMIAMESGRIISEGPPDAIKIHPRVIESYLGGDVRSIARSGMVAGDGRRHQDLASLPAQAIVLGLKDGTLDPIEVRHLEERRARPRATVLRALDRAKATTRR